MVGAGLGLCGLFKLDLGLVSQCSVTSDTLAA